MSGPGDADASAELLGEAQTLIAHARGKCSQAEVYLERGAGLDVELEKDVIASTSTGISFGGSWRIVNEGRVGFAYFTSLADAPASLELAIRQARHSAAKGFQMPAGKPWRKLEDRWDPAVAQLDSNDAIVLARAVLGAVKEALPAAQVSGGGAGLDASCLALANTEGVEYHARETGVSVAASLVLPQGERSISAGESMSRHWLKQLDAIAVGQKAAQTAKSLTDPQPVAKGGRYDLVLHPEAATELVCSLAIDAANGDDALRGQTIWRDSLGANVAHPSFSLFDDSRHPGALGGAACDGEGVPTARLPIVERGVLRNFLFDGWDANEHGVASTASAVRGDFKGRPGTGTHHLVLQGDAMPMERLVAGVDDGFLVESMLGAHTANVTTGEFSVTSPNVWRIKGGVVVGASAEIAVGGRIGELLQRLDAVSLEAKRMDGATIPSVRIRDVDVSV